MNGYYGENCTFLWCHHCLTSYLRGVARSTDLGRVLYGQDGRDGGRADVRLLRRAARPLGPTRHLRPAAAARRRLRVHRVPVRRQRGDLAQRWLFVPFSFFIFYRCAERVALLGKSATWKLIYNAKTDSLLTTGLCLVFFSSVPQITAT